MNAVLHKANTRGFTFYGWLNSRHSFSFANYYNPERMGFGALRVLNDDIVDAAMGFGSHPHDNMEIISIPLEGDLEHSDSMGNKSIIKQGDVQVMSAGTGIFHSEYNKNDDRRVAFLQIWIKPDLLNVKPRYNQISLNIADRHNQWQQIVAPHANNNGLWIHQNAWLYLANFDKDFSTSYRLKEKNNGVYVFVINGQVSVDNYALARRDGLGIWDSDEFWIKADSDTEILLIEVPFD
jgi:redox-sensitive bicupin YhaK (pirin superfamily)